VSIKIILYGVGIGISKGIFVKALFSACILNNPNCSLKEISKNNLNFKLIFTLQQRQYMTIIVLYMYSITA